MRYSRMARLIASSALFASIWQMSRARVPEITFTRQRATPALLLGVRVLVSFDPHWSHLIHVVVSFRDLAHCRPITGNG